MTTDEDNNEDLPLVTQYVEAKERYDARLAEVGLIMRNRAPGEPMHPTGSVTPEIIEELAAMEREVERLHDAFMAER